MMLDERTQTGGSPNPNDSSDETRSEFDGIAATLARIDRTLRDIRGLLDAQTRERQHREFSPARLVGAVLQVFVLGLLILALVDWLYQWGVTRVYVKLAFAVVLQIMALTSFIAGRSRA
jgi:hypothetical protein